MTSMTLLEVIGDARPEYVRKAGMYREERYAAVPAKAKKSKLKKPLLIAAVIMTLLLGACAAATNWFVAFYQARTPITEDQAAFIESHTETQNQAVTMNGYEIELFTIMADSNQLHIAFAITGPEDVDLEEMGQELCLDLDVHDVNGNYGGYHRYGVESDNDGRANTQTYFYQVYTEGRTAPQWNIHIGRLYRLHKDTAYEDELLTGKYKGQTDVIYTEEETERLMNTTVLAEGPWDFKLTVNNEVEEIQFINEPVTIHGEVSRYDNESSQQDVELTSFKLYPSGAELCFDIQGMLTHESFSEVRVVMKDQSERTLRVSDGDNAGLMHMTADSPILLEQVEKVVLPDGTVLHK